MGKKKIITNNQLLNSVKKLTAQARKSEFIVGVMVNEIEVFLYGDVVRNLLSSLLDSKQKEDLYEEFGIGDKDITKVKTDKRLKAFLKKEASITADEYDKFKKIMSKKSVPKILDFIKCFEEAVRLKDCEKDLRKIRKEVVTAEELAAKMMGSIEPGFFG